MFANFIYLLVALILYSTTDFAGDAMSPPSFAVLTALFLAALFGGGCRIFFRRLEFAWQAAPASVSDRYMDKCLSRFSIGALFLFAVDLYLLRLYLVLDDVWLFRHFPTLEALVFLGVFLFYLTLVWHAVWPVQKRFFTDGVSQKEFVLSNLSFSLPALLPWLLLSFTTDIIALLPFEQPGAFLATPLGEIVYVLLFLAAIACLGPALIQKAWRCRPLAPGHSRSRIEALCRRAGIAYRDILKWELFGGGMITAGVMGIWGRCRYILVTPGMIRLLRDEEVDAVIAHEIGHVQKYHIHFYLLFFAGYIACIYAFFDPLALLLLSGPVLDLVTFMGVSPDTVMTLGLSLLLIFLFLVYFRYGFGFFMRNFERQADLHVYNYLPDARSMITTFHKIAGYSRQAWDKPNWHHYSIRERVHFLARCEIDPSLIVKHHRKVRRMMWGYIVLIGLVCLAAYHYNFGAGKQGMNRYVAEKLILWQLEENRSDPEMHALAGDYFYDAGQFDRAVEFYLQVIGQDPENAHALNNLAWLYATCKDPLYRRPEAALALARRALAVDRSAHVLDTYAEALFINGRPAQALEASREALKMARDREAYYREQVTRFEKKYLSGQGREEM